MCIRDSNQPWAQSYGPFELLPGVLLEFAQLEDEQSKFNLNNLADGGSTDATSVTEFQQLLTLLGLETKWAPLIADWIDSDDQPNFPDGAEDSVYPVSYTHLDVYKRQAQWGPERVDDTLRLRRLPEGLRFQLLIEGRCV